jgi:hypothetical protein
MSSGAEPEDLDLGCSGKTNAGSPEEKKYFVVTIFHIYIKKTFKYESGVSSKGPYILRKDIGVGDSENGNFPLLYVVKMSLYRWVGGSKKPQNTLS